ncbi:MAG: hypothetical protein HYX26_06030 [Acidobacteriales bacterium]|nr:hypothetical protein [Terriglobales bacterium]
MYTGELIDQLIENVESVELGTFTRVVQARQPANVPYHTYFYEFRNSAEVA